MKNSHVLLTLALITALAVTFFPVDADAQLPPINLNESFVGCNGPTATYDLVATKSLVGGWFDWSFGVTPISPRNGSPNYATISFVKISQNVSVTYTHPLGGTVTASTTLSNPCV